MFAATLMLAAAMSIGAHAEKGMDQGTPTQAVLTLSSGGKDRFPTAGDAIVAVELRNAGSDNLWVNGRLLLSSEYSPPPFREVWLDIQRVEDGTRVEFNCKVRAGPAADGDYRALKPAEAITLRIPLVQCFDIRKRGTYRVQAHYRDGRQDPPPGPSGARRLSAELVSQPITVAIEG